MAVQESVAVRNARLDAIESTIGVSAVLKIRTGAQPATCATADAGTALVSMNLPSDYMSNATAGVKALLGAWTGAGLAAGSGGHYRIYASDGTTCHLQGTVTATGGGGDMTLDNIVIAVAQVVTVTSFAFTEANA